MDKTLQEKLREKIRERYLEHAWDSLVNYSYWGQKYAKIEKEVKEYEERVRFFESEISKLNAQPDQHTVEVREKVKLMREDIKDYEKAIKNIEDPMKKIYEKSIGWQQQAGEFMEIAELCKTFSVKTPEEIDADKHKPLAEK